MGRKSGSGPGHQLGPQKARQALHTWPERQIWEGSRAPSPGSLGWDSEWLCSQRWEASGLWSWQSLAGPVEVGPGRAGCGRTWCMLFFFFPDAGDNPGPENGERVPYCAATPTPAPESREGERGGDVAPGGRAAVPRPAQPAYIPAPDQPQSSWWWGNGRAGG